MNNFISQKIKTLIFSFALHNMNNSVASYLKQICGWPVLQNLVNKSVPCICVKRKFINSNDKEIHLKFSVLNYHYIFLKMLILVTY